MGSKHYWESVEFTKLFMEAIEHRVAPFHCIIHQEVLCARSAFSELNDIMLVVAKTVNFIAAWPLGKRKFSALVREMESSHIRVLMFNNVRWLI